MKPQRHSAILELVREQRIPSQEALRELLARRGIEVAQATLSRDIRELGLVKVPDESGGSFYTPPSGALEPSPTLARLLPVMYLGADGVGNLLLVRTLVGCAQAVAAAMDREEWPDIVGSVAGDDTVLIVLRDADRRDGVVRRLEQMAGQ